MPRRNLDFYETPPHYIAVLLDEVGISGYVYEPCAGRGAIAKALRVLPGVEHVMTNDVDKNRPADSHLDARMSVAWTWVKAPWDWAVSNPPFSDELAILQEAFAARVPNIAFLARLSFLEPTEDRGAFLSRHPPQQIIVLPRYSFRRNDKGQRQTDSMTCAWLVWHEDKKPRLPSFWSRGRAQVAMVMGLV